MGFIILKLSIDLKFQFKTLRREIKEILFQKYQYVMWEPCLYTRVIQGLFAKIFSLICKKMKY